MVPDEATPTADCLMKTCATCNATHKNTVERVIRCGLCVARPNGNSNWQPMTANSMYPAGPAG